MRKRITGTGRTALVGEKINCLYLRYLGTSKPNKYFKRLIIHTDGGDFSVSCECDDLRFELVPKKEYFFQIITTCSGNRIIIDVLENQLEKK